MAADVHMPTADTAEGSPQAFTTSDGVRIVFERHGPPAAPVVVLIHGWSGSRQYFTRNIPHLAREAHVIALDQRFHGDSDSPQHGFHVSRLAADLQELLQHLDVADVTAVGTSMGCAVIWSYLELFGAGRISKAVFVDQAPLQNRTADWHLGSRGCYDARTLRQLQQTLMTDLGAIAEGNASGCLSLPLPEDILQLLRSETMRCSGEALGALMADHTQIDWRPLLPRITIPCLNCVGATSGVFPAEGSLEVGRAIPNCSNVLFQRANHWLYLEQPEEFNQLLLEFVREGNTVKDGAVVL